MDYDPITPVLDAFHQKKHFTVEFRVNLEYLSLINWRLVFDPPLQKCYLFYSYHRLHFELQFSHHYQFLSQMVDVLK